MILGALFWEDNLPTMSQISLSKNKHIIRTNVKNYVGLSETKIKLCKEKI